MTQIANGNSGDQVHVSLSVARTDVHSFGFDNFQGKRFVGELRDVL